LERRLTTILAADVVEYSRLMEKDEAFTLSALKQHRKELIEPKIAQYGGRTIKLMGDGALMEFPSVVDAVTFAVEVQLAMRTRNSDAPEDERIVYRLGINIGDIIVEGDDIYGDGVNVAARMEGLADPGGICISRPVHTQVAGKLDLRFEDLGEQEVKNIAKPVRVYRVVLDEKASLLATPIATAPAAKNRGRWPALAWWQPWGADFDPVSPDTMAHPLPAKPSIAVLPFDDQSAGEDKDYLSDAISEGIITELSRFPEFFVISRNSSFQFRDRATDVRDIAQDLGVRYILEGSQQKAGEKLRVTVQLIDAVAGNHLWAERYDREILDILAVQDEITRTVASKLGTKVLDVAGEAAKRLNPAELRAFEYWLKGNQIWWAFTRDSNEQARQDYLKAIEIDPDLARAHNGLAWVHINGHRFGWTDQDQGLELERARERAQKALDLAPDDYLAHNTVGYVQMQAGDHEQALLKFDEALQLNPNAPYVRMNMAEVLIYKGRMPEAVELIQQAMRLDPHHPDWFNWNLAYAQWYEGDCEQGLATFRRMGQIPNMARRTLAPLLVCLGRVEEARAVIAKFLEDEPDYTLAKHLVRYRDRFTNPADLERWMNDLRIAGVPD
jgi:adenylate cyclase